MTSICVQINIKNNLVTFTYDSLNFFKKEDSKYKHNILSLIIHTGYEFCNHCKKTDICIFFTAMSLPPFPHELPKSILLFK